MKYFLWRTGLVCFSMLWIGVLATAALAGPYDPPASYYSGATGTGATLKNQLASAMSSGHIQRSYGEFRYSAAITDADPNQPGNILLVYNRASVPGAWDPDLLPWNREHLWPVARQPGSVNNSTTGNLGDAHALRPADPDINNARGNDPFGFENTTGGHRTVGDYYFPGDSDKGDVARQIFYSDTRYASSGLSLTDSYPTGNQMGDLSSLVAWHYLDPPDEFELRRNHAIYSQAMNPSYYTNNRNAYIDRPEFVWSVYVDQQNDSRLYVGSGPNANGSSSLSVDLGSVLVGAAVPAPQNVSLNKQGFDGVYYEVTTTGSATSTVSGRYNAFPISNLGFDSRSMAVGLNASTATAGLRSGSVVVNNLDVTTGGGMGRGANDDNDTISVGLNVLDHATASFAVGALNTLNYDFGTVEMGSDHPTFQFDVHNLMSTAGFTARLELDAVQGLGDTEVLTTNLAPFGGATALAAGATYSFTATLDTTSVGSFSVAYALDFSDEDLPGAQTLAGLMLTLSGIVETTSALSGDYNGDGIVDGSDLLSWQRGAGELYNGTHLTTWESEYGNSLAHATAVPEPGTLMLLLLALVPVVRCRR